MGALARHCVGRVVALLGCRRQQQLNRRIQPADRATFNTSPLSFAQDNVAPYLRGHWPSGFAINLKVQKVVPDAMGFNSSTFYVVEMSVVGETGRQILLAELGLSQDALSAKRRAQSPLVNPIRILPARGLIPGLEDDEGKSAGSMYVADIDCDLALKFVALQRKFVSLLEPRVIQHFRPACAARLDL